MSEINGYIPNDKDMGAVTNPTEKFPDSSELPSTGEVKPQDSPPNVDNVSSIEGAEAGPEVPEVVERGQQSIDRMAGEVREGSNKAEATKWRLALRDMYNIFKMEAVTKMMNFQLSPAMRFLTSQPLDSIDDCVSLALMIVLPQVSKMIEKGGPKLKEYADSVIEAAKTRKLDQSAINNGSQNEWRTANISTA